MCSFEDLIHGINKYIITLVRFKQIRSALHPESGYCNLTGDKYHQLRYFIRLFNERAKNTFYLKPSISFDEDGVPMRSWYCPVRMFNKDKPDNFPVDFLFWLPQNATLFITWMYIRGRTRLTLISNI